MSANDTLVVSKIHGENNKYGVFHMHDDDDDPIVQRYTEDNAVAVYTHPVAAILGGHRLYSEGMYTEYGVYINSMVLQDCADHYADSAWRDK